MEIINELELRRLLKKRLSGNKLTTTLIKKLLDESLPWEEKRSFWHFLHQSGRLEVLALTMAQCLKSKERIPFDLLIEICSVAGLKPRSTVVESVLKGARKSSAVDDLIGPRGWDEFDSRFKPCAKSALSKNTANKVCSKTACLKSFSSCKASA